MFLSVTKRFGSLNFAAHVLTYSIEAEESVQDSFSRCAPRGSGLSLCRPLFNAACLTLHQQQLPLSLWRDVFQSPLRANDHRSLPYPRCETQRGSKIPLGDYFSLVTLLPFSLCLSLLHFHPRSLSPYLAYLTWPFHRREPEGILRPGTRFVDGEKLLFPSVDFISTISVEFSPPPLRATDDQ